MSIYYQDDFGTLYCGDSFNVLDGLDWGFARMCITSPPYWAQRDYGVSGQLGQEPSFISYVENLAKYFVPVIRALTEDGTLWVNLDDTYYGSNKGSGGPSAKQDSNKGSRFQQDKGNHGSRIENARDFAKLKETKRKSLCLIPQRFAIEMVDKWQWILRNEIVWHKPNAMTESATDRFTRDFEELYMFSKKERYFFNQQFEPYLEKMNRWGGQRLKADGESTWDNGTGQITYRDRDMRPNPKGRNKRSVWSINTQPIKGLNHFAKYPEALLVTPILAGTNEGDIVLDPFFGSGTTAIVAEKLGRKWIGIELNESYCGDALNRIMQERKKE